MNIRRQNGKFQFEEHLFGKSIEGIGKTFHEVLLLMKVSKTKHQDNKMDFNSYDLYYTVNKKRDENQTVNNKYENHESDYFNFNDFVIPNDYTGRKNDKVRLK